MTAAAPLVVKLGGSTAGQLPFLTWTTALASVRRPLIVVPGGGPFANHVRTAQKELGFSDRAAHAMAILAMEQFAHMILDVAPTLGSATTIAELKDTIAAERPTVWLPSRLALGDADIPASWDITSDALAGWLAAHVNAANLLLIKQTDDVRDGDSFADLAFREVFDPFLTHMLPSRIPLWIACPDDLRTAQAKLNAGEVPGRRIARRDETRKAG